MTDYQYKELDWEHPSFLFVLEDLLKNLIGGPLLYGPYMKTFGLHADDTVLDFGCGGGVGSRCLASLLNENGRLTCVDVSDYWIARARKRLRACSNVRCLCGDIRTLDIPTHSFDVISIFHVIHDVAPAERQETVHVLSTLLKPSGRVFVREPTRKSHGMPADQIRTLFRNAALHEAQRTESSSEYKGLFEPDAATPTKNDPGVSC